MIKGEIYKLKSEYREEYSANCYNHPFIYWEEEHADYRGIMLTTSNNPDYKNIELKEFFFETGFKIGYGKSDKKPKSYIAPLYLLKDVKYDHLEKVGELTKEGKSFITTIVGDLTYLDWASYQQDNFKK